jgi:hypothetical protein
MEAFSILLQKVQDDGSIDGVKISDGGKINQLFFTEDFLIVLKANVKSAKKLQAVLALYEKQFGRL